MAADCNADRLTLLIRALRRRNDLPGLKGALESLGQHLNSLPQDLQRAVELYVLNASSQDCKQQEVQPGLPASVDAYLARYEALCCGLPWHCWPEVQPTAQLQQHNAVDPCLQQRAATQPPGGNRPQQKPEASVTPPGSQQQQQQQVQSVSLAQQEQSEPACKPAGHDAAAAAAGVAKAAKEFQQLQELLPTQDLGTLHYTPVEQQLDDDLREQVDTVPEVAAAELQLAADPSAATQQLQEGHLQQGRDTQPEAEVPKQVPAAAAATAAASGIKEPMHTFGTFTSPGSSQPTLQQEQHGVEQAPPASQHHKSSGHLAGVAADDAGLASTRKQQQQQHEEEQQQQQTMRQCRSPVLPGFGDVIPETDPNVQIIPESPDISPNEAPAGAAAAQQQLTAAGQTAPAVAAAGGLGLPEAVACALLPTDADVADVQPPDAIAGPVCMDMGLNHPAAIQEPSGDAADDSESVVTDDEAGAAAAAAMAVVMPNFEVPGSLASGMTTLHHQKAMQSTLGFLVNVIPPHERLQIATHDTPVTAAAVVSAVDGIQVDGPQVEQQQTSLALVSTAGAPDAAPAATTAAAAALDGSVSSMLAAGANSEQQAVQQHAQQLKAGVLQQHLQGLNSSAEMLINEAAATTAAPAVAVEDTVSSMLAAGANSEQLAVQKQVQQVISAVVPESPQQLQRGNSSVAATAAAAPDDPEAAAEQEQLCVADSQAAAEGDVEMVPATDDSHLPLDTLQQQQQMQQTQEHQQQHSEAAEGLAQAQIAATGLPRSTQQHTEAAEALVPAQIAATELPTPTLEQQQQQQQQEAATPASPAVPQQSSNKWPRLQSRGFMALAQMTLRRTEDHTAALATAARATVNQSQQQHEHHFFPAHFTHQQRMADAATAAAGRQQRTTACRPAATAGVRIRKRRHSSTSDSVIILTSDSAVTLTSSDSDLGSDEDEVVIVGSDRHQHKLPSPAAAAAADAVAAAARPSAVPAAAAAAKRGRAVVAAVPGTRQLTAAQAAVVLPPGATLPPKQIPDRQSHEQKKKRTRTRDVSDLELKHVISSGRRSDLPRKREGDSVEHNLRHLHGRGRLLPQPAGNALQQHVSSASESEQPLRSRSVTPQQQQQQQQQAAMAEPAATADANRVLPPSLPPGGAAAQAGGGIVSGAAAAAARLPSPAANAQTVAALRALMTAAAAARLAAPHQATASRPGNLGPAAAAAGAAAQPGRASAVPVNVAAAAQPLFVWIPPNWQLLRPAINSSSSAWSADQPAVGPHPAAAAAAASAARGPKSKLPSVAVGAGKASVREVVATAVAGTSKPIQIPRIVPANYRAANEAALKLVREAKQQVKEGRKLRRVQQRQQQGAVADQHAAAAAAAVPELVTVGDARNACSSKVKQEQQEHKPASKQQRVQGASISPLAGLESAAAAAAAVTGAMLQQQRSKQRPAAMTQQPKQYGTQSQQQQGGDTGGVPLLPKEQQQQRQQEEHMEPQQHLKRRRQERIADDSSPLSQAQQQQQQQQEQQQEDEEQQAPGALAAAAADRLPLAATAAAVPGDKYTTHVAPNPSQTVADQSDSAAAAASRPAAAAAAAAAAAVIPILSTELPLPGLSQLPQQHGLCMLPLDETQRLPPPPAAAAAEEPTFQPTVAADVSSNHQQQQQQQLDGQLVGPVAAGTAAYAVGLAASGVTTPAGAEGGDAAATLTRADQQHLATAAPSAAAAAAAEAKRSPVGCAVVTKKASSADAACAAAPVAAKEAHETCVQGAVLTHDGTTAAAAASSQVVPKNVDFKQLQHAAEPAAAQAESIDVNSAPAVAETDKVSADGFVLGTQMPLPGHWTLSQQQQQQHDHIKNQSPAGASAAAAAGVGAAVPEATGSAVVPAPVAGFSHGAGSGGSIVDLAVGSQLLLPFTQPIQGLELGDLGSLELFASQLVEQQQQQQQQEEEEELLQGVVKAKRKDFPHHKKQQQQQQPAQTAAAAAADLPEATTTVSPKVALEAVFLSAAAAIQADLPQALPPPPPAAAAAVSRPSVQVRLNADHKGIIGAAGGSGRGRPLNVKPGPGSPQFLSTLATDDPELPAWLRTLEQQQPSKQQQQQPPGSGQVQQGSLTAPEADIRSMRMPPPRDKGSGERAHLDNGTAQPEQQQQQQQQGPGQVLQGSVAAAEVGSFLMPLPRDKVPDQASGRMAQLGIDTAQPGVQQQQQQGYGQVHKGSVAAVESSSSLVKPRRDKVSGDVAQSDNDAAEPKQPELAQQQQQQQQQHSDKFGSPGRSRVAQRHSQMPPPAGPGVQVTVPQQREDHDSAAGGAAGVSGGGSTCSFAGWAAQPPAAAAAEASGSNKHCKQRQQQQHPDAATVHRNTVKQPKLQQQQHVAAAAGAAVGSRLFKSVGLDSAAAADDDIDAEATMQSVIQYAASIGLQLPAHLLSQVLSTQQQQPQQQNQHAAKDAVHGLHGAAAPAAAAAADKLAQPQQEDTVLTSGAKHRGSVAPQTLAAAGQPSVRQLQGNLDKLSKAVQAGHLLDRQHSAAAAAAAAPGKAVLQLAAELHPLDDNVEQQQQAKKKRKFTPARKAQVAAAMANIVMTLEMFDDDSDVSWSLGQHAAAAAQDSVVTSAAAAAAAAGVDGQPAVGSSDLKRRMDRQQASAGSSQPKRRTQQQQAYAGSDGTCSFAGFPCGNRKDLHQQDPISPTPPTPATSPAVPNASSAAAAAAVAGGHSGRGAHRRKQAHPSPIKRLQHQRLDPIAETSEQQQQSCSFAFGGMASRPVTATAPPPAAAAAAVPRKHGRSVSVPKIGNSSSKAALAATAAAGAGDTGRARIEQSLFGSTAASRPKLKPQQQQQQHRQFKVSSLKRPRDQAADLAGTAAAAGKMQGVAFQPVKLSRRSPSPSAAEAAAAAAAPAARSGTQSAVAAARAAAEGAASNASQMQQLQQQQLHRREGAPAAGAADGRQQPGTAAATAAAAARSVRFAAVDKAAAAAAAAGAAKGRSVAGADDVAGGQLRDRSRSPQTTTALDTGHVPHKTGPGGRSKAAPSLDPADFLEAMFLGRSRSPAPQHQQQQQQQLGASRSQQAAQPMAAAADGRQHLQRQQQHSQQQQRLQRQQQPQQQQVQQQQPQQQHQQTPHLQRQHQQRQRCSLSPPPAVAVAAGLANPWSAAKQGAKHLNKGGSAMQMLFGDLPSSALPAVSHSVDPSRATMMMTEATGCTNMTGRGASAAWPKGA